METNPPPRIEIPGFRSDRMNFAILGEVVDLTPRDLRFPYAYAVKSEPPGSHLKFDGSKVLPTVLGRHAFEVRTGTHSELFRTFIFDRRVLAELTTRSSGSVASTTGQLSDEQRRGILRSIAHHRKLADLESINAGRWPSDLALTAHGG